MTKIAKLEYCFEIKILKRNIVRGKYTTQALTAQERWGSIAPGPSHREVETVEQTQVHKSHTHIQTYLLGYMGNSPNFHTVISLAWK